MVGIVEMLPCQSEHNCQSHAFQPYTHPTYGQTRPKTRGWVAANETLKTSRLLLIARNSYQFTELPIPLHDVGDCIETLKIVSWGAAFLISGSEGEPEECAGLR